MQIFTTFPYPRSWPRKGGYWTKSKKVRTTKPVKRDFGSLISDDFFSSFFLILKTKENNKKKCRKRTKKKQTNKTDKNETKESRIKKKKKLKWYAYT